jgi:hypothetical protein
MAPIESTAMDWTTSLIVFGPMIIVLVASYAAVCIQYIVLRFSLWQLRREIRWANKDFSDCLQCLLFHSKESKSFHEQLSTKMAFYEVLVGHFQAHLEGDRPLHEAEVLHRLEALSNDYLKQSHMISQYREKLFWIKVES